MLATTTTKTFNEPHHPLKLETQLYRVTDGSFLRPENENVKRVERVFHVLGFSWYTAHLGTGHRHRRSYMPN